MSPDIFGDIRVRPDVTWLHVVNAIALDYQDGLRGNRLLDGPSLKFFQIDEHEIRQLIHEAVLELYLKFAETGQVVLQISHEAVLEAERFGVK